MTNGERRTLTDHLDDIKAMGRVETVEGKISSGGPNQTKPLLAVDSGRRRNETFAGARFHFDKNDFSQPLGHEIQLQVVTMPVAVTKTIALADEIAGSGLFTGLPEQIMLGHTTGISEVLQYLCPVKRANREETQVSPPCAPPISLFISIYAPMTDTDYMKKALEQAQTAFDRDEVPVGAVVVCRDRIIARAYNLTETLTDVTAHAEMQAITAASDALGGKYLDACTLYVTVEPCTMCAGAIGWSQLGRLVYGAADPKRGFTTYAPGALHPKTQVTSGVLEEDCARLMRDFFRKKRG